MDDSTCVLSIIMPCFNHGKYIQEALDSIKKEEIKYAYEVVIADDGSTDNETLLKLEELKGKGYKVIHQKNAGPAAARNTAIQHAVGKYILPLDADNKLTTEYINTGIDILEKGDYQIVYCSPEFFGDIEKGTRIFKSKSFDISDLLEANYIDNCAVFLKEVWTKNNGYDVAIPYYGHEDWEFWINAYANGYKFCFIPKKLFYYRFVKNSLAEQFKSKEKSFANQQYIIQKHTRLFCTQYLKLSYIKRKYIADMNRFPVSFFIFLGYKLKLIKSPFKKADQRFDYHKKS